MNSLRDLLSRDHERLDALLGRMLFDAEADREFRRGLLRHIGIEERILFPLLRKHGTDGTLLERLHRDHAALSALLVPPPSPQEVEAITRILVRHNPLEEGSGGLYERVEQLAGDELPDLLARVAAFPAVPVMPHVDTPIVRRSIAQLLREAEE